MTSLHFTRHWSVRAVLLVLVAKVGLSCRDDGVECADTWETGPWQVINEEDLVFDGGTLTDMQVWFTEDQVTIEGKRNGISFHATYAIEPWDLDTGELGDSGDTGPR